MMHHTEPTTSPLRIVVMAATKSSGYMEARNLGIEPVAVVTPRSPDAARGVVADRIMDATSLTPEQREVLLPIVLPCVATVSADVSARLPAAVSSGPAST